MPSEPVRVLMLHENFAARVPGVTREMIEAAKLAPQPCPSHWPIYQATWMIVRPLPPMSGNQ